MSSDEDVPLSAGLSKSVTATTGIAPGRMKTVSAKQRQGQRIEAAVEQQQKLQAAEAAEEAAEEAGLSKTVAPAAADDDDDDAESEEGEESGEEGEESGEEGLIWDKTHKDDENYLGEDVFKVEAIRSKRRGAKGMEYLIKWEGYDSDVNSWEPAEHVCDEDIAEYEEKLLLARNKGRAFVSTQQKAPAKRAPPPRPNAEPPKKKRLVQIDSDDDEHGDDGGEAEVSASDEDEEEDGVGDDDEEATAEAKRQARRDAKRLAKPTEAKRPVGRPKGSVNAKPGEKRPVGRPKGSKNAKPDLAWPKPKSTAAAKTARKPGKADDASPMRSHAAAATAVLPLRKRLPDPKQGWSQPAAAASEEHPAFGGPPPIEAVAPRKQNTGMLTKNSGQLAEAARRMGERKQSAGMEANPNPTLTLTLTLTLT